jgi:hypothetical protein
MKGMEKMKKSGTVSDWFKTPPPPGESSRHSALLFLLVLLVPPALPVLLAQEAPPTDKGKPSKAKWDEPLHTTYCRACEWQIREGKRAEQQMKDEAWTPILKAIQPYHTRGWKITVKCKDKWTTWKVLVWTGVLTLSFLIIRHLGTIILSAPKYR